MRLFVALLFEPGVLDILDGITAGLREQAASGHFTFRENLHLTLAFIGETARPEQAKQAVSTVTASPFPLTFQGLGHFPGKPGDIWWMGAGESKPLLDLQCSISHGLEKQGFALDKRPFRPHLTLGRRVSLPPDFDLEAFSQGLPTIPVTVDRVFLMESTRVQGRLTYRPLLERSLAPPPIL